MEIKYISDVRLCRDNCGDLAIQIRRATFRDEITQFGHWEFAESIPGYPAPEHPGVDPRPCPDCGRVPMVYNDGKFGGGAWHVRCKLHGDCVALRLDSALSEWDSWAARRAVELGTNNAATPSPEPTPTPTPTPAPKPKPEPLPVLIDEPGFYYDRRGTLVLVRRRHANEFQFYGQPDYLWISEHGNRTFLPTGRFYFNHETPYDLVAKYNEPALIDGPGFYRLRNGKVCEIVRRSEQSLAAGNPAHIWCDQHGRYTWLPSGRYSAATDRAKSAYDVVEKLGATIITGPGRYRLRDGSTVDISAIPTDQIAFGLPDHVWISDRGQTYKKSGAWLHEGQPRRLDVVERLGPAICIVTRPGLYVTAAKKPVLITRELDGCQPRRWAGYVMELHASNWRNWTDTGRNVFGNPTEDIAGVVVEPPSNLPRVITEFGWYVRRGGGIAMVSHFLHRCQSFQWIDTLGRTYRFDGRYISEKTEAENDLLRLATPEEIERHLGDMTGQPPCK